MWDSVWLCTNTLKRSKKEIYLIRVPRGSLSKVVPSSAISAANSEVKARGLGTSKPGSYAKLTQQQKAEIGKRAASTIRYYAKRLPDCPLKESSVRTLEGLVIGVAIRENFNPRKSASTESAKILIRENFRLYGIR